MRFPQKKAMSAESVRELWPVRDQLCFSAICLVLCHLCAGVNDTELAMISTSLQASLACVKSIRAGRSQIFAI